MKKMLCCFIMVVLLAGCASLPQRLMSDEDPVRGKAVSDFNGLTKEAKIKTFAEITRNFENEDLPVRIKTMRGLSEELYEIKKSSEFVSFLVKALKDPDSIIRLKAVEGLNNTGAAASAASTALMEVFENDPIEDVSLKAVQTIVNSGAIDKNIIPIIVKRVKFRVHSTAYADSCFKILGKFGRESVPALMELIQVRCCADYAGGILAKMGSEAKEAVPMLVKMSNDSHREAVMNALEKIDTETWQKIKKQQETEEKRRKEKQEAEAKAIKEEEKDRREAEKAEKKKIKELDEKGIIISRGYDDAGCRNRGKPPNEWKIWGGAFSENNEAAEILGCVRTVHDNFYCCPKGITDRLVCFLGDCRLSY
ncbi:MAG: hypothetical protein COT17_00870 [Elusimicrobia bacterium CG08_land_8_20_14_0_20_51_18]|nr:MAG: hypothetical protein COT17_00870 [Elusimicrobia bacterium CG08_land_8_20_14_0_20_51_18]